MAKSKDEPVDDFEGGSAAEASAEPPPGISAAAAAAITTPEMPSTELSTRLDDATEEQASRHFGRKVAVVSAIFIVMIIAATFDSISRYLHSHATLSGDGALGIIPAAVNGDQGVAPGQPADPLQRQREELEHRAQQERAKAERLKYELPDDGPVRLRTMFKWLGSETGGFAQVLLRRLVQLLHFVMLLFFIYAACSAFFRMHAKSPPSLSSPFSKLGYLQGFVFAGLSGLSAYQCYCILYTPAVAALIPMFIRIPLSWVYALFLKGWGFLKYAAQAINFSPKFIVHNPISETLLDAYKRSWLKRTVTSFFPSGSKKGMMSLLKGAYGHVFYAPLWTILLFGFHYLAIVDSKALPSLVSDLIPWMIPNTFASGFVTPISQFLGSSAASTPITATIGTWLVLNFGIGSVVRRWGGMKRRDGVAVNRTDYYKSNKGAYWMHLITGILLASFLLMYYFPFIKNIFNTATGVPLDNLFFIAYKAARTALWSFLSVFVRMGSGLREYLCYFQWPYTTGVIPWVFSLQWHIFSIYIIAVIIPELVGKIVQDFKLWEYFDGADEQRKKERMKSAYGVRILKYLYYIFVAFTTVPLLVNHFLFFLPSIVVPFTILHSWILFYGPFLLFPFYVFLKAVDTKWLYEPKKLSERALLTKVVHKFKFVAILLGLIAFALLYYLCMIILFYPSYLETLMGIIDKVVINAADFILKGFHSLTESIEWIGSIKWQIGITALFSILLAVLPTFLDSRVGFILYLPAYHFVLMALHGVFKAPNIFVMGLFGGMIGLHMMTAAGLFMRGFGWHRHWLAKRFVPWFDDVRHLTS